MTRTEKPTSANKGFFAVDRRAWARVCALGLNPAVAYLVLACGMGCDNRTTKWSDQAIRKYAGLSRGRTDTAMCELKASGLVREDEGGTRPRYYLMPPHEVPGCEGHMPALGDAERQVLAELTPGHPTSLTTRKSADWGDLSPYCVALELVEKGLARALRGGRFEPIAYDAEKAAVPDWIWLPNTIVMGASGETAPIHLLRQSQNSAALLLFVDLYHFHGLAEDGGVHWRQIRQEYRRHKVGERGPFVIWGFQASHFSTWPTAPFVAPHLTGRTEEIEEADGSKRRMDTGVKMFWEAWHLVVGLSLVELVGHVIEADNDTAEIVHPYAMGNGEADERTITTNAQDCGRGDAYPGTDRMGTEIRPASPSGTGSSARQRSARRDCAPALPAAHEGDSCLVRKEAGLGRMARAVLRARGAGQGRRRRPATSGNLQHQGIIKAASKRRQRPYWHKWSRSLRSRSVVCEANDPSVAFHAGNERMKMELAPSRVDRYLPRSLIASLGTACDRSPAARTCAIRPAERLAGGCLLYRLNVRTFRREPSKRSQCPGPGCPIR
jgi:hypothetical protein